MGGISSTDPMCGIPSMIPDEQQCAGRGSDVFCSSVAICTRSGEE